MNFITSIIKGIAIGAGCILPGISSGVLCVIFGIYEKLVNSIFGLFQNFKENFIFLLPIAIGIAIGYFLFGGLLNSCFYNYESELKSLFLGFVLGGLPTIVKKVNNEETFKTSFLLFSFFSFVIGFSLYLYECQIGNSYNYSYYTNFLSLFISGFAMSAGIVIPGVSSTVILMCLGTYFIYLDAISTFNILVLFPMCLGIACGGFFFLILISFLLKNYSAQTYYSIVGFSLGSIFVLLPSSFSFIHIFLFIIGFILSLKLEKEV